MKENEVFIEHFNDFRDNSEGKVTNCKFWESGGAAGRVEVAMDGAI
jgi:hypothetical protein